jgi:integrase
LITGGDALLANSSRKRKHSKAADRPKKPYPEFPLYAHPLGYWSKKIRGEIHHFGRWGRVIHGKLTRLPYEPNWQESLATFKAQVDDIQVGRTSGRMADEPTVKDTDELTIKGLGERFLTYKSKKMASGELGSRMFDEYHEICQLMADKFGKHRPVDDLVARDFEELRAGMADRWGPVRLSNAITRVKSVFKYGYEAGLIDRPFRFSLYFKKPSASVLRRHRAKNGQRMLEAEQISQLLDRASFQVRAMLLLGINAGLGNHDIATLPMSALDLDAGWINYSRPKTGIPRRCPLWPETIAALREVIIKRPKAQQADAINLVFLTARGCPWLVKGIANPVSVAARKLIKAAGMHHRGIGFYTLRHVFRTVADAAQDSVAVDLIMGHCDPSMGARYRERIDNSRLVAVSEHVRQWLFGKATHTAAAAGVSN